MNAYIKPGTLFFINLQYLPLILLLILLLCTPCQLISATHSQQYQRPVALPGDWQNLTHSEWIKTLKLKKQCLGNENIKHLRFVNIINTGNHLKLLILLCDPGAYQDSHLIYLISPTPRVTYQGHSENQPAKYHATPIQFNEIYFKSGWNYVLKNRVTGNITFNKEDKQLIISRRYSGTWSCGYIARYQISDIIKHNPLFPVSAKGDNNCDNDIKKDQWSEIQLPGNKRG